MSKLQRREKVLYNLQIQLEKGKKPERINGKTSSVLVDLSEKDIKRINNEIEILSNRVRYGK